MNKIPPEIAALPLPEGMEWEMLLYEPAVRYIGGNQRCCWINYEYQTTPGTRGIRITSSDYRYFPGATLFELCQALSNILLVEQPELLT